MRILLQTSNLSKSFLSGGKYQHVLKNVDLSIYEEDFTVIMGPSGSGKSTLLYALSGMDTPSSGAVFFGNEIDIAKLSQDELADFRAKNCGFIFQQIYLVDSMSLLDNVLLSGLLINKNKREVLPQANRILRAVNIDESMFNKFPSQVSGGEAQRVAVARAAVTSPKILFADEPTGALNSQNSKAVLDILTRLNNQGQSIVMVTHDINSAVRANRILYLMDGTICGELKIDKYTEDDEDRKTRVKDFLADLGW